MKKPVIVVILCSVLFGMGMVCPFIQLSAPYNGTSLSETARPNILWIVTEDNSADYLKLYHPRGADMPHLSALAAESVVFDHAFSNAPVCSVARSSLITGCYAPRIGAQYHRKMKPFPMPEGLEMFPYYLREAGYYTTNRSKEDYNLEKSAFVWDESSRDASYENRNPGQPFFHVVNIGLTHEGNLHFPEDQVSDDFQNIDFSYLMPYLPSSNTVKYTFHRFVEQHRKADNAIGTILQELEKAGQKENTIVFYFGDHGGVLPRSKGYLYESGLHVPLVIHFPEKFRHLFPLSSGTRCDAFVEFVDFAPTVLNLAGAHIPEGMDGLPFAGSGVGQNDLHRRNTTFGYADRFDEKYDLVRSMRKNNFKYIRNYQPFNFDGLYNFYRYRMLAYQDWKNWYDQGKLNPVQSAFFESKSPEALYDLEKDPHEINNLVADPQYRPILLEMRKMLQQKLKSLPDLSFFPESFLLETVEHPVEFGKTHQREIVELLEIADYALEDYKDVESAIINSLSSMDPWKRYWGLIVCSAFGTEASNLETEIFGLLQSDENPLVKIRALEYLALFSERKVRDYVQPILDQCKTEAESLIAMNSLALVKSRFAHKIGPVSTDLMPREWWDKPSDVIYQRIKFLNE